MYFVNFALFFGAITYLGYLNQKYEMDFRCMACSQQVRTHITEHKIRKLSEISASEAENYLGYQTVGTGWLHYTLYHTDSNAWIILFFVIYSSHARNSYSLEIILYIKPSSHHQHRHRHCRFHCYCHRHPSTQIKSIQLHCTLMNVLGKASITYQLSQSSWQIVDTSLFVLCCWTSNRRYGKNVSVQYKYIYEQWASLSLKPSNHLPSPAKCVRNLWILSLHIPFYLVKHLPFLPFRWALPSSTSSW